MRLKKIKLAGFKSFVDPITIEFPGQLSGIVGPNGCGKSNVIDAVRWVMGESSAKQLRGESLTDVIFNGAATRKPVGQASVELVFDNSEGKVGGEFAKYNELSVRREVTREGQSNYYLNGTRCRKRDITDIFMGTGLGPRSYAVIEQGTISRIVDAKPLEMRAFIEEAAGISLYKKRRHDTELRLKHTQDNLDRLLDISREQEKLLVRLKRQSESAARFKVLKEERDTAEAQLAALKWKAYQNDMHVVVAQLKTLEVEIERYKASRTQVDLELTKSHQLHQERTKAFEQKQEAYYKSNNEISKIEQQLLHLQERVATLTEDIDNARISQENLQRQRSADEEVIQTLEKQLSDLAPLEAQTKQVFEFAENNNQQASEVFEHFSSEVAKLEKTHQQDTQTASVERTKIEQLEQAQLEAKKRITALEEEHTQLSKASVASQLSLLEEDIDTVKEQQKTTQTELSNQKKDIKHRREKLDEISSGWHGLQEELQILKGKQASLEALQEAHLAAEKDTKQDQFMQDIGLPKNYMAESLQVAPDYELALENVLSGWLNSICVNEDLFALESEWIEKNVNFSGLNLALVMSPQSPKNLLQIEHRSSWTRLKDKLQGHAILPAFFEFVYVEDSLAQARVKQPELMPFEMIVTKQGVCLGSNWIQFPKHADNEASFLKRKQSLGLIVQEVESLEKQKEILATQRQEIREVIEAMEVKGVAIENALQEITQVLTTQLTEQATLQTRLNHIKNRKLAINQEIELLQKKREQYSQSLETSRHLLEITLESMAEHQTQLVDLQADLENKKEKAKTALEEEKQAQRNLHDIHLKMQTLQTEHKAKKQTLERSILQLENCAERMHGLTEQLAKIKSPEEALKAEQNDLLLMNLESQKALEQAKQLLEETDETVKTLEAKREKEEAQRQALVEQFNQLRLDEKSIVVRRETIEEDFRKYPLSLETTLAQLPEQANEATWQQNYHSIEAQINKLGPINLAAIEEYDQELERKQYIDKQNDDLQEALETLLNAIKKIDKETKSKFQETFEFVNQKFQELFPVLFGGGHASLEMDSHEILESGILIMARPPGKKNASIHLLSGGEKALTAIALIFAIFKLNPAPFCILDEVDAPLDDVNVGRFCKMVKLMSETVQFIYITHNKITMEMADRLSGVTMREAGVSRLVSVALQEAANLVEETVTV